MLKHLWVITILLLATISSALKLSGESTASVDSGELQLPQRLTSTRGKMYSFEEVGVEEDETLGDSDYADE